MVAGCLLRRSLLRRAATQNRLPDARRDWATSGGLSAFWKVSWRLWDEYFGADSTLGWLH